MSAALASVLALGAATWAGTAPAQAASEPPPFTAFSLNVAFDMSTARATSDATKAMKTGSVGGFQEYSGRVDREALVRAAAARGFAVYMPTGTGVNIPIVWRKARFDLVSAQSTQVYGVQDRLSKARAINVVRVKDKLSGRTYAFVNTHTISGGARAALPTGNTQEGLPAPLSPDEASGGHSAGILDLARRDRRRRLERELPRRPAQAGRRASRPRGWVTSSTSTCRRPAPVAPPRCWTTW